MNECKNCKNGCFAGVCTCQCHQKPQSWESDFDRLYEGYKNLGSPITKQAEIKLFISQQIREAEEREYANGYADGLQIMEGQLAKLQAQKEEILRGLPKTEEHLEFDPATKSRRIYVDGFNKCLTLVQDLINKI